MNMTKRKKTDFTAELGDERKKKFQRIAEARNRSMTGQLKDWIDNAPDPAAVEK